MSYTVVGPGGPKPRPGTVSARDAAAVHRGGTAARRWRARASPATIATKDIAFSGPDVDTEIAALSGTIGVVVGSVFYVLLAVGFGVLGMFVSRGKNVARIVTWVVAGLVVLCCGCTLLGTSFGTAMLSGFGDAASQDVLDEIAAATPAWLSVSTIVVGLLILLALIAVIVLLTMPASNDYFRKEQEVWVPPTWPGDPATRPPVATRRPPAGGIHPAADQPPHPHPQSRRAHEPPPPPTGQPPPPPPGGPTGQ